MLHPAGRRRIRRRRGSLVVILAIAPLLPGCRGRGAVEVETARVERRAVFRSTVTASGEIVAERYADVGSSVMGKLVSLPWKTAGLKLAF